MRVPNLLVPSTEPATVDVPAARRRRRVVTAIAIVVGTALLAATLRVPHGSAWFTVLAVLVAATWTVGSFVSGPIPFQPDRDTTWRTFLDPVVVGIAAFGVFVIAYLVARHLPLVGPALDGVLATADAGPIAVVLFVALVNGAGEELFFRGALHAALEPHHPAIATTVVYVVVTAATGNLALVIAAAVMGALFSLERLSTRGVLAPIVTHLTWSTLMVLALPRRNGSPRLLRQSRRLVPFVRGEGCLLSLPAVRPLSRAVTALVGSKSDRGLVSWLMTRPSISARRWWTSRDGSDDPSSVSSGTIQTPISSWR